MAKKILLVLFGGLCLVVGIALVLSWWPAVVLLFEGVVGMALALTGLLLIFMAQQ